MLDNKRSTGNSADDNLYADGNGAESVTAYVKADFLSNGFKLKTNDSGMNMSGRDYIYMAIAEDSEKHSNAVATFGDGNEFIQDANYPEDNFNIEIYTGNASTRKIVTGLDADFVWIKERSAIGQHSLFDSVRGVGKRLDSSSGSSAESNAANSLTSFNSNGFGFGNESGNNNNVTNIAWSWKAAGHEYKSARFNGASSSASKIVIPDLTMPTNDYSVSAWIWLEDLSGYNMILTTAKTNGGGYFYFTVSGHQLIHYANTAAGENTSSAANTIKAKQWIHCVVTKSSTDGTKLYIDNSVSITQSSYTGNNITNTTSGGQHTIGGYNTGSSQTDSINGKIDQVRIFNKAISSTEVATLYNETKSTVNTLQVLGDTSCIATYRLNGDATDLSGNYNGTETNVDYQKGSHFAYNIYENKARTFSHKASDLSLNIGTTTPYSVNANRDNGFSIVKFPALGSAHSKVPHGLSSPPQLIIYKNLDVGDNWYLYTEGTGLGKYLNLNTNGAAVTNTNNGFTSVNSNTFTSNLTTNTNDTIAYVFHSVAGYQSIGTYTGSSSAVTVDTGFNPKWVLIKRTNLTNKDWCIFDQVRSGGNNMNDFLVAGTTAAEFTNAGDTFINGLSNGFSINAGVWDGLNANGGEYFYWAIAR